MTKEVDRADRQREVIKQLEERGIPAERIDSLQAGADARKNLRKFVEELEQEDSHVGD